LFPFLGNLNIDKIIVLDFGSNLSHFSR
jgi:hypothetical protein